MSTPRSCLQCGATLLGRPDKKYCDDHCRSSFNNQHYAQTHQTVRHINRILFKNRKILEDLYFMKPTIKVKKEQLTELGFNFNFFTQIKQIRRIHNYFVCYDFAYLCTKDEEVIIKNLLLRKIPMHASL
ncbi:MAG: hypothetical protein JNL65_12265 [Saprospiraceae bacterium]|nr:hypothetical protein [Saprospiraceae bacterium]